MLAASMLAATMLAACGQSNAPAHGAGVQQAKTVEKSSETTDPDMVSAVSTTGSTTPIGMKFRLAGKPVVGTPLQIAVALIPAENIEINHIHAEFQAGEGLELQSDRTLDVSDPQSGVAFEQQLTVLPRQAGVLSLSATVVIDMDTGSIARTYTIPVIALGGAS